MMPFKVVENPGIILEFYETRSEARHRVRQLESKGVSARYEHWGLQKTSTGWRRLHLVLITEKN